MAKSTKPPVSETEPAADGPQIPAMEQAVRFRFNQHSFLPGLSGSMGQVQCVPPDIAARLKALSLGDIEGE